MTSVLDSGSSSPSDDPRPAPVEFFKDVGSRLSNWGRWGRDDQRGTLNFITPAHVVEAGRLIRRGQPFALGLPIDGRRPSARGRRVAPVHTMSLVPSDLQLRDGAAFADDRIAMPVQCGTQWDGLAHCLYDDALYNGHPASIITRADGAQRLGIDQLESGIVGRGVLLDVARARGVDNLPAGCRITADDLTAVAKSQAVDVRSGDILLVRTGWSRKITLGPRATGGLQLPTSTRRLALLPEPGLSQNCCDWLHERQVAAVASDNYALEVIPVEDDRATLPVHCILIRDMGMTIGEMFDLEALAADCAGDGVWEFFFAAPPLRIARATGSPVNPVAIK